MKKAIRVIQAILFLVMLILYVANIFTTIPKATEANLGMTFLFLLLVYLYSVLEKKTHYIVIFQATKGGNEVLYTHTVYADTLEGIADVVTDSGFDKESFTITNIIRVTKDEFETIINEVEYVNDMVDERIANEIVNSK